MRIILLISILTFSSCKKDYRCYCVNAAGEDLEYNLHSTKKKAAELCDSYETSEFSCEVTDY
jgi:hypothetical protein